MAELADAGKSTLQRTDADQASQLPFNSLTLEQFRSTKDQLLQTEFQLVELEARLQAKQAEVQQAARVAEADSSPASHEGLTAQQRERIADEFKHDPEVASLIDQIRSTTEELEHKKGVVKKAHDPALVELQRHLTKLNKEYNNLWEFKGEIIRRRMLVPTGAPGAPEVDSLAELKTKVDELKIKKTQIHRAGQEVRR